MRRTLIAAACILLLPALVHAAAYTATLTGSTGTGFATINVTGETIDYNILVSGISPTSATLSNGSDTIDLGASFIGGVAIGSVSSSFGPDIVADPGSWEVEVGDGSTVLTGMLGAGGGGAASTLYFPVVATVAGQAGTDFHTDARLVNRSGDTATVELAYWPESSSGNSSPAATATETIGANEQLVLDDVATELFGVTNGKGAVSITSDRAIFGSARVYNDQIAAGQGTFGQYVRAVTMDDATTSGAVEFLSNEPSGSGTGYRSNIGLFNPNTTAAAVTLYGWDADGTLLGSTQRTIGRTAMQQFRIDQLWPALADYGDHYVTFSSNMPIFVYGSVVDNVNGDAVYVPATAAN
jgi:hypothetical protein